MPDLTSEAHSAWLVKEYQRPQKRTLNFVDSVRKDLE
jgi:hypothetical protein